jgi:hypothetical protein
LEQSLLHSFHFRRAWSQLLLSSSRRRTTSDSLSSRTIRAKRQPRENDKRCRCNPDDDTRLFLHLIQESAESLGSRPLWLLRYPGFLAPDPPGGRLDSNHSSCNHCAFVPTRGGCRMAGLLDRERIVAPPGYNRWRVPVASVAIRLCIGSVHVRSIYNPPLTKVYGVVASAANDRTLGQVVWVFTVAIVFLGLRSMMSLPTPCPQTSKEGLAPQVLRWQAISGWKRRHRRAIGL